MSSDMPNTPGDASGDRVPDMHGEKHWSNAQKIPDPFPGAYRDSPWTDKDLLEELYVERRLSMNQIRKGWDCSGTTVSKWLDAHGIEKRSASEAAQNMHGNLTQASFYTHPRGYERWRSVDDTVDHHRLLAALKYGVDEIRGMDAHHKNGVRWDNRLENIEIVDPTEHKKKHLKIDGIDRLRVAEMYEHGDISSRDLGSMFDVCGGSVLRIHREGFPLREDESTSGQVRLERYL